MKLVWRVSPAPTGMYRSFEKRGWPTAYYGSADGLPAAFLRCEEDYEPAQVRSGNHPPISVVVLHHNHAEVPGSWKRFVLKHKAATLDEAKKLVASFLESHEDWHPKN